MESAFMSFSYCNTLFRRFFVLKDGLQKVQTANHRIRTTKGTRFLRKARKYRRPEDLEDKHYYGIGPHHKIESATQSLSARGFARERKQYDPPTDVSDQIQELCKKINPSQVKTWQETSLSDSLFKYKLLTECIRRFKHDIPNPILCKIKTVGDVVEYYSSPVVGIMPYDALQQKKDQFPNMHIIADYDDFNPDTDTFFGGQTAFPGRRRIIYTETGAKLEDAVKWPKI